MSYKVKGSITTISDIADAGQGKKLSFRIDTGEQYNNILEFELYKGAEYLEHLDKFKEFNKIGDSVEVEFNIKSFNWTKDGNDKIFTSLSCWRVEKVGSSEPSKQEETEEVDSLPF